MLALLLLLCCVVLCCVVLCVWVVDSSSRGTERRNWVSLVLSPPIAGKRKTEKAISCVLMCVAVRCCALPCCCVLLCFAVCCCMLLCVVVC